MINSVFESIVQVSSLPMLDLHRTNWGALLAFLIIFALLALRSWETQFRVPTMVMTLFFFWRFFFNTEKAKWVLSISKISFDGWLASFCIHWPGSFKFDIYLLITPGILSWVYHLWFLVFSLPTLTLWSFPSWMMNLHFTWVNAIQFIVHRSVYLILFHFLFHRDLLRLCPRYLLTSTGDLVISLCSTLDSPSNLYLKHVG